MKNIFSFGLLFLLLTFAAFTSLQSNETQFVIVNHTNWTVRIEISEARERIPPHSFFLLSTVDIEPNQTYSVPIDTIKIYDQHRLFYLHTIVLENLTEKQHVFEDFWGPKFVPLRSLYQIDLKVINNGQTLTAEPIMK